MTGADFQAEGHRLAQAYALVRPNGPDWLAAWQAGDRAPADELMEWELEGHPFTGLPLTATHPQATTPCASALAGSWTSSW